VKHRCGRCRRGAPADAGEHDSNMYVADPRAIDQYTSIGVPTEGPKAAPWGEFRMQSKRHCNNHLKALS